MPPVSLDKTANADGLRRSLELVDAPPPTRARSAPAMPPLLAKLVAEQAATGLPSTYLPKDELVPEGAAVEQSGGAS